MFVVELEEVGKYPAAGSLRHGAGRVMFHRVNLALAAVGTSLLEVLRDVEAGRRRDAPATPSEGSDREGGADGIRKPPESPDDVPELDLVDPSKPSKPPSEGRSAHLSRVFFIHNYSEDLPLESFVLRPNVVP